MSNISSAVYRVRHYVLGILMLCLSNSPAWAQYMDTDSTVVTGKKVSFSPVILKTNLLYDVALMPSVEMEYRFDPYWSVAVETSIAWWHNDHRHWYYQLASLIPEVRYRFAARKSGHCHVIGGFGGAAWYDLENGGRGYKGEAWAVGLSYAYSFPINDLLGFEAGVGVGYMKTTYEEYLPIEGHYVYQQTGRTSFLGPLRLKFALVFDLDRYFRKGGAR